MTECKLAKIVIQDQSPAQKAGATLLSGLKVLVPSQLRTITAAQKIPTANDR